MQSLSSGLSLCLGIPKTVFADRAASLVDPKSSCKVNRKWVVVPCTEVSGHKLHLPPDPASRRLGCAGGDLNHQLPGALAPCTCGPQQDGPQCRSWARECTDPARGHKQGHLIPSRPAALRGAGGASTCSMSVWSFWEPGRCWTGVALGWLCPPRWSYPPKAWSAPGTRCLHLYSMHGPPNSRAGPCWVRVSILHCS